MLENQIDNKRTFFSNYFLPNVKTTISTLRYIFLFLFGTTASVANIPFIGKLSLIAIAFILGYIFYKKDQKYYKSRNETIEKAAKDKQKDKNISIKKTNFEKLIKMNKRIEYEHKFEKIVFLTSSLVFQYLLFYDLTVIASIEFSLKIANWFIIILSSLLSLTSVFLDTKSIIATQQKLNKTLLETVYTFYKNKQDNSKLTAIEEVPLIYKIISKYIGPICLVAFYALIQVLLFSSKMKSSILFYATSSTLLFLGIIGTLLYHTWKNPTSYNIFMSTLYALSSTLSFTLVGSTYLNDIFNFADTILKMPQKYNSLWILSNSIGITNGVAYHQMLSRNLFVDKLANRIIANNNDNKATYSNAFQQSIR